MDKLILLLIINCFTFSTMAQSPEKNVEDSNKNFYENKEITTEQIAYEQLMDVQHTSTESLIEQSYKPNTDTWVNHSKYEHKYDEAGNKSTAYWHIWHQKDQQWLGHLKKHPEYDENGNLQKITTYQYLKNQQDWLKDSKLVFEYNRHNQLSESVYFIFQKNHWKKANKKEFIYNGRVEEIIQYRWNSSKNDWQTHFKIKHVYNGYGNIKNTNIKKWNTNTGRWFNFKKHEYEYNTEHNLKSITRFYWSLGNGNEAQGKWLAAEKNLNTYENEKQLNQSTIYKWNKNKEQWLNAHKKEYYQHNAQGQAGKSALFYWNTAEKNWVKGFQSIYKLSPKPIPALASNDQKNYLNPVNDTVISDIDKSIKPIRVQQFDIDGKEIISQMLGTNGQAKGGHFGEAMYLYKLQRDGVTYTGNFQQSSHSEKN